MTEGQEWAISQLKDIVAVNNAVEILSTTLNEANGSSLALKLSINCQAYEQLPGGLPLRNREIFVIDIPANFPLHHPQVRSNHKRFANSPHVQWGNQLCLYQASETEWNPGDGLFGFFDRLDTWLRSGALGQLDPIGLPLHPPVAYSKRKGYVIPNVNTPVIESDWWAGYVEIKSEVEGVSVILGDWHRYNSTVPSVRLAGAILLPDQMPFEYPSMIHELQSILTERSIPPEVLQAVMSLTAIRNEEQKPLYIMLGAAMRGIAGEQKKIQHLAAWYISPERATNLRNMVFEANETKKEVEVEAFKSWASNSPVEWCTVRENRPEIVVARDSNSPMEWWRGKKVVILGCGALGSAIGMMIVRAGIASVRLYDKSGVAPGLLVRQNFNHRQIGYTKCSATSVNLRFINPSIDIEDHYVDIIKILQENPNSIFDADVVINATASVRVATSIEKIFVDMNLTRPPIISMVVSHHAEYGLVTYAVNAVTGVVIDLDRRTKIALANMSKGQEFLNQFWPRSSEKAKLFQPEPGCSDPTFVGSAADVFGLSASLLNIASRWLAETGAAYAHAGVLRAPHITQCKQLQSGLLEFAWPSDQYMLDKRHSFQIRLAPNVPRDLKGWIKASERKFGRNVETGGLLFGQIDEFLKVIWISEISGPPPDSTASATGFMCGIKGTKELNDEKRHRSRGSVYFIGMWHTHPEGVAQPSITDLEAMTKLRETSNQSPRNFLMVIVGGHISNLDIEGFLFEK